MSFLSVSTSLSLIVAVITSLVQANPNPFINDQCSDLRFKVSQCWTLQGSNTTKNLNACQSCLWTSIPTDTLPSLCNETNAIICSNLQKDCTDLCNLQNDPCNADWNAFVDCTVITDSDNGGADCTMACPVVPLDVGAGSNATTTTAGPTATSGSSGLGHTTIIMGMMIGISAIWLVGW